MIFLPHFNPPFVETYEMVSSGIFLGGGDIPCWSDPKY